MAALIPASTEDPSVPPEELPFGRGALAAVEHGVDVVFGEEVVDGRLCGFAARPGRWERAEWRLDAVFDRFRDQLHPHRYQRARDALGSVPWANAPEVVALCRDKLASQRHLVASGVPMPEVVDRDFEAALAAWGSGFAKPRYGSFGRGVRRVRAGESVTATGEGMRPGDEQPTLLQRAIAPPSGIAGVSVRALVQRVGERWVCRTPVARISDDEPVVNVARGAAVVLAAEFAGTRVATRLREVAIGAAEAVAEVGRAVEVGVDLVLDPDGGVWVIEVNGRPRGRLAALAVRDPARAAEHIEACAAPLIAVAAFA